MDIFKLQERIEDGLHKVNILFLGIIFLLAGFIFGDTFFSKYIPLNYLKLIYAVILVLWISFWFFYKFYIQKNKKNQVGIVICIHTETNEDEKVLKLDFINKIKKQILEINTASKFNIIIIKNHQTEKFNTTKNISRLHKRVKGHFYVFGEVKKRNNEFHLSLEGLVLHRPIPQNISNQIATDFNSILPKSVSFKEELSFKEFSTSAEQVVTSVKYIVGLAAFVSGDYNLALQLHEDLQNSIQNKRINISSFIKTKLDTYLASEHGLLSQYYFMIKKIPESVLHINKALSLDPKNYNALIMQSFVAFSVENDPLKSLKIVKKCSDYNFPQWRYNETFLYFWINDYEKAIKGCEKLQHQNYFNEKFVSLEVIDFNNQLLLNGVNNPSLYYWLGYNYWYKQNNITEALVAFEKFEELATPAMAKLKNKSTPLLIKIRQEIGINK